MNSEKRAYPRFAPEGMIASIKIEPPPPKKEVLAEGEVIDMSYTGIKIKLTSPLSTDIDSAEIKIMMTLPQSNIPILIQGNIRHWNEAIECGVQFSELPDDQDIDKLMFECIKSSKQTVQI